MSFNSWLQNLRSALAPSLGRRNHRRRSLRAATHRPNLEVLEDRCVPSTFAAFDLGNPESGPFPSDRFTVADASQLTGRRVDLPLPDRATRPSDYDDVSVINTLDGFNLQPRLSIAFSGPIDVNTVNSNTVFLIKLADPTAPEEGGGQVVGINQTVWDVATNTLHVESDELVKGDLLSFNAFFLAMAHWQLGAKDKAHEWYDPAVRWMDKNQPTDEELRRFRAEAAELLGLNGKK